MAGRKTKYTPELVKKITDALSIGATHEDAFTNAGISRQTFYRWIETKSDFCDSVNRAQTNAHLAAVGAIRYAIQGHPEESTTTETYIETRIDKEGKPYDHRRSVTKHTVAHVAPDWRAAIDYLKRRDPASWSDKLNITLEYNLSPDQINRIARILADAGEASPGDTLEKLAQAYAQSATADTGSGEASTAD